PIPDLQPLSLHDALPIYEPIRHRNSRSLGSKSHGDCVSYEGDKSIDARADFYSQDIERRRSDGGIRGAHRAEKDRKEHRKRTSVDRKSTRLNSSHVKISY